MRGRDAVAGFGAGLGLLINNYQQCGSALGGGLGQGKYIFGWLLFNHTLSTLFRSRMRAGRDGGFWMRCSINRTLSMLAAGRSFLLLGPLGAVIFI